MMASVINGAGSVSVQAALLCTCVSLVLGLVIAAVYMLQGAVYEEFCGDAAVCCRRWCRR